MYSRMQKSLVYLIMMIAIICADSTTIPPQNTTANNTKMPRLLNNNRVSVAVACFSGDTLVTLVDGKQISIGELQPGDQLFTVDGTRVSITEMMMMLDRSEHSLAMFQTIITHSGHKLSLTALHLLLTLSEEGIEKYKPAKDVQIGDILRVILNGEVSSSRVANITNEIMKGFYAPVTMSGTLLVNSIVASSYANINDHHMAHICFQPLRWYYQISRWLMMKNPFYDNMNDGIHIIPKMLYQFARLINPSALRVL